MTKEEAIAFGNQVISLGFNDDTQQFAELAVKALEQHLCEECVSRQAVDDAIYDYSISCDVNYSQIMKSIDKLPSVTPQPKMGHWIEKAEDYYKAINEYGGGVDENTDYFTDDIACPKCLSKFSTIDNETERFRHCPNCGAKMVEPQESEE